MPEEVPIDELNQPQHTASANVSLVSSNFDMPQLGRTRRTWIYLPADYANSTRSYPVLYLQDGQNIFDAATSFAGEWGVDKTLNQLHAEGQNGGCIAVAVANDSHYRFHEYSPWAHPRLGGGHGQSYADFLVHTLKPYIDANYRTLSGREHTGIAGSSMGGLIATYAALRYPEVFSKVAAFSPAFWFAKTPLLQYLQDNPANPDTRFYFTSGATESPSMLRDMTAVYDALLLSGIPATNLSLNAHADGAHAEWFWQREFRPSYQWLYRPSPAT